METGARDYRLLLMAINEVVGVLGSDGADVDALAASFDAATSGFGAENALLLMVEGRDPLRLKSVRAQGALTPRQIHACEQGQSVPGVSPSVIRRVVETAKAELIKDRRLDSGAARTASLEGDDFSVLCAPILDLGQASVLAVVYFQNRGLARAYGPDDLGWLEGYSGALSRVFGYHLSREKRDREVETLSGGPPFGGAPEIVGDSAFSQGLRRRLHDTFIPGLDAAQPDPVLILGERGTGKDLIARYLHAYSSRSRRPFVVVNCAEITDELAASRFFGHRRGAFTGAIMDEPGFFRAAKGGVLFLDEVAELSLRAQASLLRVLESYAIVPVGETREVAVDAAVVIATNRDLAEAVREGALRPDFYDRFRTQAIRLLPLRDRPWDIPMLLEHFRRHHEARHRKRTLGFTPEVMRMLVSYPWPGNVRELARACSLFVTQARAGARIDRPLVEGGLPDVAGAAPNPKAAPLVGEAASLEDATRAFQRELIISRLERNDGNVRATRESLGLTKTTYHRYARALGITPEERVANGEVRSED